MSIQVTAGPRSLVALGLGISDVATLVSLGQRLGNWMTAASGDADFLELLDQDEMDIIRRRGLVDVARFNKQWGTKMALLINGEAEVYEGDVAEQQLEKLGRFTALMVCVVAALDAFAPVELVKSILGNVLLELLRTTDYGADVLKSRYPHRLNSWRSSATLRGLSGRAREIRHDLVKKKLVIGGLMPKGDSEHMVDFVVWLLAESSESYVTPSSDVAGVALCLSQLGIDILSVEGFGQPDLPTSCRLIYNQYAITQAPDDSLRSSRELLSRVPRTTVSLQNPEESLSNFPVDAETGNRCRAAWSIGVRAAQSVACRPLTHLPNTELFYDDDFKYVFYDSGKRPRRTRTEIHTLAWSHAFFANDELYQGLEEIFQHESPTTLAWLLEQTNAEVDPLYSQTRIWNFMMQDAIKINAFTVFQAFFMGYFYSVFLNLVDISPLRIQTVEGAWGYRSPIFLRDVRTSWLPFSARGTTPGLRVVKRESVLSILAALLLGKPELITRKKTTFNQRNWCLGVIEKRALLARSLLKPCRTIREVGCFVMLDVDVSGIPVDTEGLVRPGIPSIQLSKSIEVEAPKSKYPRTIEDATFHIEPDWDGNPENMLLCVRYMGRRVETINPATADVTFLRCVIPPTDWTTEAAIKTSALPLSDIVEWTVPDLLGTNPFPQPSDNTDKVLTVHLSLPGRPRLRYFAAEKYQNRKYDVRVVTNNIQFQEQGRRKPLVIIDGGEPDCSPTADDWAPREILYQVAVMEAAGTIDSNDLSAVRDYDQMLAALSNSETPFQFSGLSPLRWPQFSEGDEQESRGPVLDPAKKRALVRYVSSAEPLKGLTDRGLSEVK
ncbi:hypothetical protein K469DRAFT_706319 [Zopfia rhizophila CBS 207.26]|uniref:Uncharacterized protein n=1 Tax=Zopfia rhizophila CBS 207.26 TaxID=1314779 RepID=A0A6A6EY39_9PEZI|nr:hypothetical protein K469DRAFT_706319 [Zopfia rhizophila CBS 207.26]